MKTLTIILIIALIGYNSADWLQREDNCTVPMTNEQGRCITLHECDYGRTLLQEGLNPKVCGFIGKPGIPLVCCPLRPNFQNFQPGSLTRAMCNKYFDPNFHVYAIDFGHKALAKEFRHMVAIGYGESKTNILWLCGGSIISHYFVLSAAHCVEAETFGPAKWARLGDLDLANTTDDANPLDLRITEAFVHPLYKVSSHYHDIALFKLEEKINFVVHYKPACLHTYKEIPVNLQVTGWGKQGLFGEMSSHLLKANLTKVDYDTCARKYANVSRRKLKNGILDESQICAGDEEGADTCPGDSGGPLHYLVERPNIRYFVVAGITSFGKGCGGMNSIGIYTRVSAYIGWIESVVWPEE